jgi:hypothetical protein
MPSFRLLSLLCNKVSWLHFGGRFLRFRDAKRTVILHQGWIGRIRSSGKVQAVTKRQGEINQKERSKRWRGGVLDKVECCFEASRRERSWSFAWSGTREWLATGSEGVSEIMGKEMSVNWRGVTEYREGNERLVDCSRRTPTRPGVEYSGRRRRVQIQTVRCET